jgi:beta-xylosidase
MKDGDCAGLAAFNSDTGALVIKKKGKRLFLQMVEMTCQLSDRDKEVTSFEEKVITEIPLTSQLSTLNSKIYLRIDADFRPGQGTNRRMGGADCANFSYSTDGEQWTKIGSENYRLSFDWRRFFMGTKFGIFCYATKKTGGYVDVDEFCYIRAPR